MIRNMLKVVSTGYGSDAKVTILIGENSKLVYARRVWIRLEVDQPPIAEVEVFVEPTVVEAYEKWVLVHPVSGQRYVLGRVFAENGEEIPLL